MVSPFFPSFLDDIPFPILACLFPQLPGLTVTSWPCHEIWARYMLGHDSSQAVLRKTSFLPRNSSIKWYSEGSLINILPSVILGRKKWDTSGRRAVYLARGRVWWLIFPSRGVRLGGGIRAILRKGVPKGWEDAWNRWRVGDWVPTPRGSETGPPPSWGWLLWSTGVEWGIFFMTSLTHPVLCVHVFLSYTLTQLCIP